MQPPLPGFALAPLLLAYGLAWLTPVARTAAEQIARPLSYFREQGRAKSKATALAERLTHPISLDKGIDANTPFKDALEYFSDHFGLTILIDIKAFKELDAELEVEAEPVALPKMNNIALATVLRRLLVQIPPRGATYLVRDGFLEIIPRRATAKRLRDEPVVASFNHWPLEKALQHLSDLSGVTVVVDVRLGDKARMPVTATLKNDISLEGAVRLLADMAGLKAVVVGGGLYVTTQENASALFAEEGKKVKTNSKEKARSSK